MLGQELPTSWGVTCVWVLPRQRGAWQRRGFHEAARHERERYAAAALDRLASHQIRQLASAVFHAPASGRRHALPEPRVERDALLRELRFGTLGLTVLVRARRAPPGGDAGTSPPADLPALPPLPPAPAAPAPGPEPLHFVAVRVVDEEGKPVEGIQVAARTAGGELRSATTNTQGKARIDDAPPGQAVMSVTNLDGSLWRPLGGAPASPVASAATATTHVVTQGECLSKIAARHGVPWSVLWNAPENADLRSKRKSPHVLLPGDVVQVPALRVHQMARPSDAEHTIEVKRGPTTPITIALTESPSEEPTSGSYRVYWGGGAAPKVEGTLSGSATLTLEVPLHVESVTVELPEHGERLLIKPSHLDPLEDAPSADLPSGAAARLASLGYLERPSPVDAEALASALKEFQRVELGQAEPSGKLDANTAAKLEERFGA